MPEYDGKADEQEDAEAEVERFEDQLGPFVVAAETTRMAMVFTNAKEAGNPIIFANDSVLALTGYARDEVLGQGIDFLMARGADEDALAKVEAAFRDEAEGQTEIECRRKDGSTPWTDLFVSPVADADG